MTTTPTTTSSTRGRGLTLAFICSGIVLVYLDLTIVNVALPAMQQSLHAGISQLQWIVDGYALVLACLLLSAGTFGDMFGRKRLFVGGLAGFIITSALCALAPNYDFLLIARVLQGATGSVMVPLSLALVSSIYTEPRARAGAIGVWAGIGGLAMAAGPVLGGVLVEALGWQVIFWINVPVGLAALIVLAVRLPAARPETTRRPDMVGQVLFVLGIAALVFGLIQSSAAGWGSPMIIGALAVAVVALALFVVWELRTKDPMLPLAMLRNPVMVVAAVVNFFGLFGLFSTIFLLTLYLQRINGLSTVQAGIRFLALNVAIMVFSYLASKIAAILGPPIPIVVGSLMSAGGLLWLTTLQPGTPFAHYWWALSLIGAGVSLVGAPATVALLGSVRAEQAGTATGVSNTFRQVGSVFGVAIAGTLLVEHLHATVPGALASVPLGPGRGGLVGALSKGDLSGVPALPPALRDAVLHAVGPAVTGGIQLGMYVAAVGTLVGGILAAIILRRAARRPATVPAQRAGESESDAVAQAAMH
jgi:DHA2 family methylenomycin A resistance protein-like MFS transporter